MDNTYVVYCEEYYFSMRTLSTILRKQVYTVSENMAAAEEVCDMMRDVLQKTVDSLNAYGELLTTFDIKVVTLNGSYSIAEAKDMVIDDDCGAVLNQENRLRHKFLSVSYNIIHYLVMFIIDLKKGFPFSVFFI